MTLPDVKLSDTKSSKNPQSQNLPSFLITLGPLENTPEADESNKTKAQAVVNKYYSKTADLDKCVIGIETGKTGYHHMHVFLVAKNIEDWNTWITSDGKPPTSGIRWKSNHIEAFRKIGNSVHANHCPKGRLNRGQKFDDFDLYITDPTKDKEIDANPIVGIKRDRYYEVPDDKVHMLPPKLRRIDTMNKLINTSKDCIQGITKFRF